MKTREVPLAATALARSRRRACHPVCAAVVSACLLALGPSVAAQTVRGELVEESDGGPIAGGFVLLLDTRGNEVARVLTDGMGRFALAVPRAGVYRLRATVVGRESWRSQPFSAVGDTTLVFRIAMPMLAVTLPAVVVEADRNCQLRAEAGAAAAQLWDEARKALEAIVWTERQGTLFHRIARYDRTLDPRTLDVVDQAITEREGVYRGSPFTTQSPSLLVREGYVRESPSGEWIFDAPDAAVLLSDAFANVHCFSVTERGAEQPGLIGLAFEPILDRDVADVEGVLWLDRATAQLRYLEFEYAGLPGQLREVDSRLIGGRLDFARLPSGPWMVQQWWIRMPEIGIRQGVSRMGPEVVLLAIREQGGWVDEVAMPGGGVVWQAPSSVLDGRVTWLDAPVVGADIALPAQRRVANTDREGRFHIDSLAPGRHVLVFTHEAIDPWLNVQPPEIVTLGRADTVSIEIVVSSPLQVRAGICPQQQLGSVNGMLAGLVREAETGVPVAGASVRIAWRRVSLAGGVARTEEVSVSAVTDERGYYFDCRIPSEVALRVDVADDGFTGTVDGIRIGSELVRRLDVDVTRRD